MTTRIVDVIRENEDVQPVREEWDWLVEPLASCIKLKVSDDPDKLYVDLKETSEPFFAPFAPKSSTFKMPDDWVSRYQLILENLSTPLVLIGDIGVGKSSWVCRFEQYLNTNENTYFIHYDHHIDKGSLVGQYLSEEIRLYCTLTAKLIECVKIACERTGLTSLAIFQFEEELAISDPKYTTMSLEKSLIEACNVLKTEKGVNIFIIIDNLDEYRSEVQQRGIAFADFVSKINGVYAIISLRPETYHRSPARLPQPRYSYIHPVSLSAVLEQRLDYLWQGGGRPPVKNVLDRFKRNNISLNVLWAEDKIDYRPVVLKRLHQRIVAVLTENNTLVETLQKLHNYNMRESLEIISCLLKSGYFSDELINSLKERKNRGATVRSMNKSIITTYFRGPYLRYRGKTNSYPVKNVNIFDLPVSPASEILIAVRVLQTIGKEGAKGIGVKEVIEKLNRFGYNINNIKIGIQYLAINGMIRDVSAQKPWEIDDNVRLDDEDVFALAPAGNFLITKLFTDYAFRYCEAVADTMGHPRPDGEMWKKERGHDAIVFNAIGVLGLIVKAGELELNKILNNAEENTGIKLGTTADTRKFALACFKEEFDGNGVLGARFILSMSDGCKRMYNYFVSKAFSKYADYSTQNKLKSYSAKVSELQHRAEQLTIGDTFL